jgi:ribosomal protein S18 acetylase RimI-like enzyme
MSDPMTLRIRPLRQTDQAVLWDLLHIALWDPPPAPLRPREVLELPQVRIYAEAWGRPGDVGVAGELPGVDGPVGACWMRLVPDSQGMAWVDEHTPQLGIALFPRFQHQGHGRPLMMAALAAAKEASHPQVSLTVHPQNPAISLYERCGFRKAGLRNTFHLMLARP